MHVADSAIFILAAAQFGVFSRQQVLEAGGTRHLVESRLRSGAWIRLHPGVYGLPGYPDTWRRRLWAAYLAVGEDAVVSHEAAAQIHGMEEMLRDQLTFIVPHSGWHRIPGAVVHQYGDLTDQWIAVHDGLRITTPARTGVDLAAVLSSLRLGHLVEHAETHRIASRLQVGTCLGELSRPGKRGMRKLARVLDRQGDKPPPMSELERRYFTALAAAGVAEPIRQYPFPGRQVVKGCADSAWVDAMLITEIDSRQWHTRIAQMKLDRDRDNEAARAGWQTLRFLWEHVVSDTAGMIDTVVETRRLRLKLLGHAS